MGDSEFSSVRWDSPSPSDFPDTSDNLHINNNGLVPTSPLPTQTVPPDMDPLQTPPSNEHTLICTVSSPQKEADGTKDAYVSYLVTTETTLPTFQGRYSKVRRRFTDFVYLHNALVRDFPACAIPPLPGKQRMEYITGDRFGTDFTSRRASSLNRFLLRLSLHPVLRRTPLLCTFLESGDWNSHMKRYSTSASASSAPRASNEGVGGYIPDVLVNAFTKLHKTDRKWIEIRERIDKLDEDIGHVEKLMARIVRKEGDIGLDYAEMSGQVNKLQSLEPNLAEAFAAFAKALDQTALSTTLLKETTDTSYFESLRDLSSYFASLRGLLKSRDQKQLDFEALTDYLSRTSHERDMLSSPHTSGNFIRNRMEDMRGIDHEQSRKDRLRKLEFKIQDLTREVEHSKLLSEAFDQEVEREGQEFEKIRGGEMKVTLGELASAKVEFFRKMIDEWEKLIPELEGHGPPSAQSVASSPPFQMVVDTSLYDQLGVKPTATPAELKKAYHKFALANHPDKVPEAQREKAHATFQQAQDAYDILKDPESRAVYDEQGLDGMKNGGGGHFHEDEELAEMLNQMFGAGVGGFSTGGFATGSQNRASKTAVQEFEVTLEDLYKGKQVKMMSKRKVVCSHCKGGGGKAGAKPKKCPACSGTGQKVAVDMFNRMAQVVCHDCNGSGSILHAKDRCKKCKGAKLTDEKKPLEFWIERGMEEGDQIVLKGEADQEPGRETGDVIFVLKEADHPVYSRMGPDLKATLHITLKEALCGFSRVILTTLDGRGLKYTHKKGQVIRPRDVFKVAGEGMPLGKKSDEKGDLYLDVEIDFPPDGWLSESGKVDTLANLLSIPSDTTAEEVPEIVDEVIIEKADPEDFGGEDGHGWETESDGESSGMPEQCATQ